MVLAMGFIHDWKVLTVLRALLGIFEAGLFPGSIYIVSTAPSELRYTNLPRTRLDAGTSNMRQPEGYHCSIWLHSYHLGLVQSLLMHCPLSELVDQRACTNQDGDGRQLYFNSHSPANTYRIFIIEGIATIVAGLVAPFFLVEFPERVKFLNPRQKHIAIERVKVDKLNKEVVHPNAKEVLTMLLDWKLALYGIQYFICASSVYSLAFFQPIILRQGMGFSYAKAQLLSSPPYVFAIFASLTMAYISDKIRMRWPIICTQAAVGIVGLLVILYTKPPGVRYFGLFLAVFGCQANIPGTLAYGNNQTARNEKKGVVAAAMISMGAIGGIAGYVLKHDMEDILY